MSVVRRLRIAWAYKTWPWRIPKAAVDRIGLTRPPEHVFYEFRRIHGIDE